ncbi:MAG: amino acid ABC transporter permease [Pirellulales bacterium]|nr:amino acid ABC transporter permease [Pirellulales bacterium]
MTKGDFGFVRTEMAETLPPPSKTTGVLGWFRTNLFSSWSNTVMTLLSVYVIYLILPPFIEFVLINAIWLGDNREACLARDGACWAYVGAFFDQFVYGRYPAPERWRVNLVFFLLGAGLIPLLTPRFPFKRENILYMLIAFPVAAFVLLTGGGVELNGFLLPETWIGQSPFKFWCDFAIVYLLVAGSSAGLCVITDTRPLLALISTSGLFALLAAMIAAMSVDVGLVPVETSTWGGLLTTLVIAVTGIAASLPLGTLLALGRRSNMQFIRLTSIIFIEFWRGVPLITVLFMSSVVLPLFLPEGASFDKLLRALIGVALFSAAYMAEVVRGGLQAIPAGQYEGARALGLSYWKMMGLVILPQALKLVIPGIVNNFIGLFKDTTLVLIIGLFDLLGQVQASFNDPNWASPLQSLTGYTFTAVIFFFFCFAMSRYAAFMERRLHTGHKP